MLGTIDISRMGLMSVILWRECGLTPVQLLGIDAERRTLRTRGEFVSRAELALQFGFVTYGDVVRATTLYRRLITPIGEPKPLGQALLESGLATGEQVLSALLEQQHTGERLGGILVHQGIITLEQLRVTLERLQHAGYAVGSDLAA